MIGALAAAPAHADDRVYWSSPFDGLIRSADLSGGPVQTLYDEQTSSWGLDIDVAGRRLIWGSNAHDALRFGPLDGSAPAGSLGPADGVQALAIDAAGSRVLWLGELGLHATPLAGGESAPVYPCCDGPPYGPENGSAVAVDDVNGRVYFSSGFGGQSVYSAPLDGSGPIEPLYGGRVDDAIPALAVDPVREFVYWSVVNNGDGSIPITREIKRAPLDGSGPEQVLYSGEYAGGLAVDAAEGKLYWAASEENEIHRAPLDGSGPVETVVQTTDPYDIVLLRTPLSTGAPQVSGGSTTGSQLSCSDGSWTSEDIHGSFVHRPALTGFAYRWQRNGTDIAGARAAVHTPSQPGDYRCVVTATNIAGSTDATSPSRAVTAAPSSEPDETLALGDAFLSRSGAILVPIICSNRVTGRCEFTLTIRFRKPTRGFRTITRRFSLRAGTPHARITPSRKQRRKLLRLRKQRVTVTLTTADGDRISRNSTLIGRVRLP